MKIVKEIYNVRCDMGVCQNMSNYEIDFGGNKRHNLHICSKCFEELYEEMSKIRTPKSPKNIVKIAEERKKEWSK